MQILCEHADKKGRVQKKTFDKVIEVTFYDKAQGICLTFEDGTKCSIHINDVRAIKNDKQKNRRSGNKDEDINTK